METAMKLITFENEVFRTYVFWLCVLCLKMLLMAVLTAYQRISTNTYANLEDATLYNLKSVTFDNPPVERVRRAHRNDLENIIPMLFLFFVYILTDPEPWIAINLIRISGLARILHTLVYTVWIAPQPTRGICFAIPNIIMSYMIFHTIIVSW